MRSKAFSNKPAYVRVALAWMRTNKIQAWRSDKDGIFVVASQATIESLVEHKIRECNDAYISVGVERHAEVYRLSKGGVGGLRKQLHKLGYQGWARECCDAYDSRGAKGLVSRVSLTVP